MFFFIYLKYLTHKLTMYMHIFMFLIDLKLAFKRLHITYPYNFNTQDHTTFQTYIQNPYNFFINKCTGRLKPRGLGREQH